MGVGGGVGAVQAHCRAVIDGRLQSGGSCLQRCATLVAITKASQGISVLSARMTVFCSGSMARTDPTTVAIPDNASVLGWMETLSWSRHPRITHGRVKPRECEKSSSTMVMSRSLMGTPDSRESDHAESADSGAENNQPFIHLLPFLLKETPACRSLFAASCPRGEVTWAARNVVMLRLL